MRPVHPLRGYPAYVSSAALLYTLAAAITLPSTARAATAPVELPAGSVNGLAAAIAQAGSGGTVVLKSGRHKESGPVVITAPITLTGETGAILESATAPVYPNTLPITITPALYFKGAPGSLVQRLGFQPPAGKVGSAAVIFEDSPGSQALGNRMTNLQYGIVVQRSDNAMIRGNTVSLSAHWDLDPTDPAYLADATGILISSANHGLVVDNQVFNGVAGINVSGPSVELARNTVAANLFGILMCSIPADTWAFAGAVPGASITAPPPSQWYIHDNAIHNNQWGVLATDRASNNVLANNDAAGNQVYDMELTGDTMRFGVLGPSVYDNLVLAGAYTGLIVKDCGRNDRIVGDVKLVDNKADPCN